MAEIEETTEETPSEEDIEPSETSPTEEPESDSGAVAESEGDEEETPAPDAVAPADAVATPSSRPAAAASTAAPPETVPQNPFAVEYPKEFRGYAVKDDGGDLFDLRFEDPNSDEAAEYFTSLVRKNGGDEDAANREYDREVNRYDVAKGSYENHVTGLEESAARAAIPAVQAQVNEQGSAFVSEMNAIFPDLGKKAVEAFHGKAVGVIAEGLKTLTDNLIAQGMTPRRAEAKANTLFAAEKNLYRDALDLAIGNDPVGYARLLLETAGVIKPSSAGGPAPASSGPPRSVPPPMGAGGGRGGQPEKVASRIVPTDDERSAAEAIGKDPVEFARAHRERFALNGSGR